MKGITHFLTGLALASFFPDVVEVAEAGSILPVLGGIGGLLPDTLDFKFVQFWEKYDIEIDPGPEPNAKDIADIFVLAIKKAYDASSFVHLRTHTIQLGANTWLRYTVEFIPDAQDLLVTVGPVIKAAKMQSESDGQKALQTCRRKLPFPITIDNPRRFDIDILSGPSFLFTRDQKSINIQFLEWHRRWTHSILLALVIGLCCFLVTGLLFNMSTAKFAALLCGLGYAAHVIVDQCGFMGSSLWWPLSRKRIPGLGLFHSNAVLPNFISVSLSIIIIIFNLGKFSSSP